MHGPGKKNKSKRTKFWHGGVLVVGVDHFLGAPLAVTNIAADEHEHLAYPGLMRLLIPISRVTPYYQALRKSHQNCESVFRRWRDRYGVAGKNADARLKRRGIPFQQLRASAALAIEWFRICLRYGWLGSARRREYGEFRTTEPSEGVSAILTLRKKHGLGLPYGPAAVKLGLARAGPSP